MEIEQQELPFPAPPETALLDQLAHIQAELETLHEGMLPKESPCGCTGPTYSVLSAFDLGALARLIVGVGGIVNAAKDVKDLLEQHTIRTMPDRQAVVDGFVLERKSGTVRKAWDHPLLASVIARGASVDRESGEILMKPEDAQRVMDEFLTCAGVGYWRTGPLRDRGIDPDTYCEKETGRPSLIVRAPQ
jgi:hypothetical protein